MTNLLTILTVRSASERLPGKALAEIKSKVPGKAGKVSAPLVVWIARRLRQMNTPLIVATTTDSSDNELTNVLQADGFRVIRGSVDDVVGRMQKAVESQLQPKPEFVFRALADCPFLHTDFVIYAAEAMAKGNFEAFVYYLNPECWPIYSTREFPYSTTGWNKIVENSRIREHPDVYFHQNRRRFRVLYHQAPPNWAFRPYRLEVDWPEDLELVRAIADGVGVLESLPNIIKFLDLNPDIAKINADRQERTGPLSLNTYSNGQRREWLMAMVGKPFRTWTGRTVKPPDQNATPVFCTCGHSLGWGHQGQLYLTGGGIMAAGFPQCSNCGLMVREWKRAI